ncbi:hypothetical protein R6Q59_013596 [Mikania micrantha]
MWMLKLVMMVFTRTRSDEDSQLTTNQSRSACAGTKRRCKRTSRKNRPAEQPVIVEEDTAAKIQTGAEQPGAEIPVAEQCGSFELLRTDNVFMEYADARLRAQWIRIRGALSQHWKKKGGKTNPLVAISNMKSDCRSEEDWNHLCDSWSRTNDSSLLHSGNRTSYSILPRADLFYLRSSNADSKH